MSELNEAILAKVEESVGKINDYDQRSALGMVRSWLDSGRLGVWEPQSGKDKIQYPKRDQLASDLVALIEESGAERGEVLDALAEARAWVNAPFLDPTMNGEKMKAALAKPGEAKKMREKSEK